VANYARLKQLIDRWIDLSTELSDLKLRTPRSSYGDPHAEVDTSGLMKCGQEIG
jgi:hypothetical protein